MDALLRRVGVMHLEILTQAIWQCNAECGPTFGAIDDMNMASMSVCDSLYDRHAKPGTFGLRREKWFKNSLFLFACKTWPAVRNCNANSCEIGTRKLCCGDFDSYRVAASRKRVLEQVSKHLLHAKTVTVQYCITDADCFDQFNIPTIARLQKIIPR